MLLTSDSVVEDLVAFAHTAWKSNGAENTVKCFAGDTKLRRIVDLLVRVGRLYRDLDRLDQRAEAHLIQQGQGQGSVFM